MRRTARFLVSLLDGLVWPAVAAAIMLAPASRGAAQSPTPNLTGRVAFDRPEAWALKYFAAVSTFTGLGPPVTRNPGSIDLGVEVDWIPHVSESQRRVGFDGTALEDLNKTPIFGRPRLLVGLPGGVSAELGWVPPVQMNGARANLVDAALERPFLDTGGWTVGLRLYGQVGHVKGDFTCPADVASQPPGSAGNPQNCDGPSQDTATLDEAGLALTGGVVFPGGASLHFAGGATYNDLQFQVGALESGKPDNALLWTHGWTGWVAAGAGLKLGERLSVGLEAFYSPLSVRRPPAQDSQNDGLFNVRAFVSYHLR